MASTLCTRAVILRNICFFKQTSAVIRHTSNLTNQTQPPTLPSINTEVVPVQQKLLAHINVEYHGVPALNFNDETVWLRIFQFPYLISSRYIIKTKVYLTGLSISAIAYQIYSFLSLANFHQWTFTKTSLWPFCSIGGLLFIGNFFRKFICQAYVSEDLNHVRLSRFTFFGKRRDLVLPVSSILPLTETNSSGQPLFLSMHTVIPNDFDFSYDFCEFYDNKFLICLKYGGIKDIHKFEHVFGRVVTKKFF